MTCKVRHQWTWFGRDHESDYCSPELRALGPLLTGRGRNGFPRGIR